MITEFYCDYNLTIDTTVRSVVCIWPTLVFLPGLGAVRHIQRADNIMLRSIEFGILPSGIKWFDSMYYTITATGDVALETEAIYSKITTAGDPSPNLNRWYAWNNTAMPTSTKYDLRLSMFAVPSWSMMDVNALLHGYAAAGAMNLKVEHTLPLVA